MDIITEVTKGGGQWEFFDLPKTWDIQYKELKIPLTAIQLQTYRIIPRTGSELGLVFR